jgi:hypothetical protein
VSVWFWPSLLEVCAGLPNPLPGPFPVTCEVTLLFDPNLVDPFTSIRTALTSARSIPDILASFQPAHSLQLSSPSGPVSLGAEATKKSRSELSETAELPGIAIAAAPSDEDVGADGLVKNETETRCPVAMFDPDAQRSESDAGSFGIASCIHSN